MVRKIRVGSSFYVATRWSVSRSVCGRKSARHTNRPGSPDRRGMTTAETSCHHGRMRPRVPLMTLMLVLSMRVAYADACSHSCDVKDVDARGCCPAPKASPAPGKREPKPTNKDGDKRRGEYAKLVAEGDELSQSRCDDAIVV